MEISTTFFLVLAGLFLVILFFNVSQNRKKKEIHHCPKCDSIDVVETDHQTQDSRTVIPNGGGSPAGGDVRLQLDMKLFLRCKVCGHGFQKIVTRTY